MAKRLVVAFDAITEDNIEQLRNINTASFPVHYTDGFYEEIVNMKNERLNKFAYYKGIVVGAVCARLEDLPSSGSEESSPSRRRLYIKTLAVLAAYRGREIGSQLLISILDYCRDAESGAISEIALHVQISNQDAIRFYTEKFGFVQGELVENYYRRINPPHCYLLYKKLDATSSQSEDQKLAVAQKVEKKTA